MTRSWFIFALISFLAGNGCAQEDTLWLDEMDLSAMTSGWGSPKKNQSVLGYDIQMSNQKYDRGVGVHAESKLMLELGGKRSQFHCNGRDR